LGLEIKGAIPTLQSKDRVGKRTNDNVPDIKGVWACLFDDPSQTDAPLPNG